MAATFHYIESLEARVLHRQRFRLTASMKYCHLLIAITGPRREAEHTVRCKLELRFVTSGVEADATDERDGSSSQARGRLVWCCAQLAIGRHVHDVVIINHLERRAEHWSAR